MENLLMTRVGKKEKKNKPKRLEKDDNPRAISYCWQFMQLLCKL